MDFKEKNQDALRDIYKEIAESTNFDVAMKINELYGGLQICFPKQLYTSEYIKESMDTQFKAGMKVKDLAKKFGYSERWVRKILGEK